MAILTVTTTSDVVNAGDGVLSLREAINNAVSGDEIVLGADTYTLTLGARGEEANAGGDLDIVGKNITIRGDGSGSTIIQGGTQSNLSDSIDRVFHVLAGSNLTLQRVTVRHGDAGTGEGGGLFAEGNVSISEATISQNSATTGGGISASGGGAVVNVTLSSIANNAGLTSGGGLVSTSGATMNLLSSVVSGNLSTTSGGGGVFVNESVFIARNSAITANTTNATTSGGGGILNTGVAVTSFVRLYNTTVQNNYASAVSGNGGGISQTGNNGVVTLQDVSLTGNTAGNYGGGIENFGTSTVTVTRSTIAGNTAFNAGGGIRNAFGNTTLTNSTIANNEALSGNGGGILTENGATVQLRNTTVSGNASLGIGAGIYASTAAVVTLNNSIVANHNAGEDVDSDTPGLIVAPANNVVEEGGGNITVTTGAVVAGDPGLLGLADNGGSTQTLAIANTSSSAFDASTGSPEAADQRELPASGIRDLGAFEFLGDPEINILGPSLSIGGQNLPAVPIANGDTSADPTEGTDFAIAEVGSTGIAQDFTIQNLSSVSNLSPVSITITGAHPNDFVVTVPPPSFIDLVSSEQFRITFQPTSPGDRTATVEVRTNDADEGVYTFDIKGIATGTVSLPPPPPLPDVPDIAVQIGQQTLSTDQPTDQSVELLGAFGRTVEQSLRIFNTGTSLLTLQGAVLSPGIDLIRSDGTAIAPALLTNPITPDSFLELSLRLNGAQIGQTNGILRIFSNDPDEPALTVPLSQAITFQPQSPISIALLESLMLTPIIPGANSIQLPRSQFLFRPQIGDFDETFIGTAESDVVIGLGGNDNLLGLEGDDILKGNQGNDQLEGGPGNDRLTGSFGRDSLVGGSGNDIAQGSSGDDLLSGGVGNDGLLGDSGNDFIDGGEGNDLLFGGSGNDSIAGRNGGDILVGEGGNDLLAGNAGADILRGGNGDDALDGGEENDLLLGEAGNDVVFGNAGSDSLLGGDGADTLDGGMGIDTLIGGEGVDIFVANVDDRDDGATEAFGLVADFEDGIDLVAIAGLSPIDTLTWSDTVGGTGIFVNGNQVFQIIGINSSVISSSDFVR
ncbi:MAG: choice-of-anchor D domain-containing protein [Cyanophyceae cyanobacterium]